MAYAGGAGAAIGSAAGGVRKEAPPLPPPLPPASASAAAGSSSSSSSSAGRSSSSSTSSINNNASSRLAAYTSLLSASNLLPGHTVADLYSLRHLSIQGGVPDQPSWLRPQAWRVLLGYLPPEKREWHKTLTARRHEYAQFLVDFFQPLHSPPAQSRPTTERDVLLDQLYKDLIRSRKNGFAFYHADVAFPAQDDPSLLSDRTHAHALELRQTPLHRLRGFNHDYAAVTAIELGHTPSFPPTSSSAHSRQQQQESSALNTPVMQPRGTSADTAPSSSAMPAPPTILLPGPEIIEPQPHPIDYEAAAAASQEQQQPAFEALFDPAQHSSTPAGDAPAPFAADAVALPPPSAMAELDDLTKILDQEPEPSTAQLAQGNGPTGALQLDTSEPSTSSAERASSSATFASVVENVMVAYNSLTNGSTTTTAEAVEQAIEDIPAPQQAMLEARKAHQDGISEAAKEAEEGGGGTAGATSAAPSLIEPGLNLSSARSDGSGSASRTPIANPIALPPAHAVEGHASTASTLPLSAVAGPSSLPSLLIAPPPAPATTSMTAPPEAQLRDRRWHAILRILYVYALLNPSVGYIQGLNEVAFVIYWVMSHSQSASSSMGPGAGGSVGVGGSNSSPRPAERAMTPTTPRQNPLSPMTLKGDESGASPGAGSNSLTPTSAVGRSTSYSSDLVTPPSATPSSSSAADNEDAADTSAAETTTTTADADELDLEADAFWCFSLLVGSMRELYEFDGIDHAVAGLRVRNSSHSNGVGGGGGGSRSRPSAVEQDEGWSRAESGMAGALRRLSLRLRWVDEPLWIVLRRASLDPRLPYYSFRWLACLLSNELALPSVVRLWDALLAEQDSATTSGHNNSSSSSIAAPSSSSSALAADASTGLAESSKVEFLIDICAALLVRLREPLMRMPPRSSRRTRARRQRTIRRRTTTTSSSSTTASASTRRPAEESDSDAPYSHDEDEDDDGNGEYDAADYAQDDFAYKMHILQTFPDNLDLDVDVGPLLEQAYLCRQRRMAADLTGDGPPTYDEDYEFEDYSGGVGVGAHVRSGAGPALQSLGQRASSAWSSWRTKTGAPSPGTYETAAGPNGSELGMGVPSVAPAGSARPPSAALSWFSSIGTRFASMPTSTATATASADGEDPISPTAGAGARRLGGSALQRYAEALSSSDAAANLSKASTNLTARALAVSASWNTRSATPQAAQGGGQDGELSSGPTSPVSVRSPSAAAAGPSSFFAKARSVSASYMGSMTTPAGAGAGGVSGRSTSYSSAAGAGAAAAEDSDSSFNGGVHPRRWSRVPIPNFPLPDPNDSDGRRSAGSGRGSMTIHQRLGSEFSMMRPPSPEGSEAGSESSSGRRMLPSLRMAAKLGLLPSSSSTTSSPSGGGANVGPKPLMLSGAARPPREQHRERTDANSDLEMSRKVSSGPMGGHHGTLQSHHHRQQPSQASMTSPTSSPRDSISSMRTGSISGRGLMYSSHSGRRPQYQYRQGGGYGSSRAGSESGGEFQTISSPPSENGSGGAGGQLSRRSSLTRGSNAASYSIATGGGRDSISSSSVAAAPPTTSRRPTAGSVQGLDDFAGGAGGGASMTATGNTVSASKFVRAAQARAYSSGSVSGAGAAPSPNLSEDSAAVANLDHTAKSPNGPTSTGASTWTKPIASSSDIPLVRSVDASLRSRQRRRRQDTASSLESNSMTPTDGRNPMNFGNAAVNVDGGEVKTTAEAPSGEPVRYQLTDGPVMVLDRSADTVVGTASGDATSSGTAVSGASAPGSSSRTKFRSRMGSTRSLGSGGTQSKRSSVRSLEDPSASTGAGGGVLYVSASEVLAGGGTPSADVVDIGPPLLEGDEDGHDDEEEAALAYPQVVSPTVMETTQPLRRRNSPKMNQLHIDTGSNAGSGGMLLGVSPGNGSYSALASSPLPSPGPEAGMFVSADSLLAELGAELEGFSSWTSASDSPSTPLNQEAGSGYADVPKMNGGRRRLGQRSADLAGSDWAMTAGTPVSDAGEAKTGGGGGGDVRRHSKRISEVVVPQGTMAAIGSAFTQLMD